MTHLSRTSTKREREDLYPRGTTGKHSSKVTTALLANGDLLNKGGFGIDQVVRLEGADQNKHQHEVRVEEGKRRKYDRSGMGAKWVLAGFSKTAPGQHLFQCRVDGCQATMMLPCLAAQEPPGRCPQCRELSATARLLRNQKVPQ